MKYKLDFDLTILPLKKNVDKCFNVFSKVKGVSIIKKEKMSSLKLKILL